jgi:hypothetical protein
MPLTSRRSAPGRSSRRDPQIQTAKKQIAVSVIVIP